MRDAVPGAIVALRLKIAERYGAKTEAILQEVGINGDLYNPKTAINTRQVLAMWQPIIRQTGLPSIGLECGLEAKFQTMGILGYVIVNSPNVLLSLEKFCAHQKLVLPLLYQKLIIDQHTVKLAGSLTAEWQSDFQYSIDYILSSCWAMIKNGTLNQFSPIEVGFVFPEPTYAGRYREVFDTAEVKFSCDANYLLFRKNDLERSIPLADENLYKQFDRMLDAVMESESSEKPYTLVTKRMILNKLKASIPKINELAREQALSVRALQQHLKLEGTSYRQILQSSRKDLAIHYLSNSKQSMVNIAFLIGFADLASFSKNFKKWTGLSPTEYRNKAA